MVRTGSLCCHRADLRRITGVWIGALSCRMPLNIQGSVPGSEYTPRRFFELEEFPLLNDREKGVTIEDRGDVGGCNTRLLQEMGEGLTIECMQQTVADRFSESSEVMQHDLSLGPELVLVRSAEMMTIEYRKIGRGVEGGEDEPSLRTKDAIELSYHGDG